MNSSHGDSSLFASVRDLVSGGSGLAGRTGFGAALVLLGGAALGQSVQWTRSEPLCGPLEFARAVDGNEDVNGDGIRDVLVGSRARRFSFEAMVQVVSGDNAALLLDLSSMNGVENRLGWSVSFMDDLDGDSLPDVAAGAPASEDSMLLGNVRIYGGVTGGIIRQHFGDSPGDLFGTAIDNAGDVNNDGVRDLIVGASHDDNNGLDSGSVKVYSGAGGAELYSFDGDVAGAHFGESVSGAGDVNNDGFADFIVGASGSGSGQARVFSGQTGMVLHTFAGDASGDRFGISVSGAGDVNGDGFADVIVGSTGADSNGADAGRARVYSGQSGALLFEWAGFAAEDEFGKYVRDVGDVNGDSSPDVAVSSRLSPLNGLPTGSVTVFSGADGSVLLVTGSNGANPDFGAAIAGAGDLDGDGQDDLIVCEPSREEYSMANARVHFFKGTDGTFLGGYFRGKPCYSTSFATGVRDQNGDGYDDVLVDADEIGGVQVLSGFDGAVLRSIAMVACKGADAGDVNNDGVNDIILGGCEGELSRVFSGIDGTELYAFPGKVVAAAGDVNADGHADMIFAKPSDGAGLVHVRSGQDGSILHSLTGLNVGDSFGASVCTAGDFNGDGFDDFFVGAPGVNFGPSSWVGEATVFSGLDGSPLRVLNGSADKSRLGAYVAFAGDVDNDGRGDVIVAEPGGFNSSVLDGPVRVVSGTGAVLYELWEPSFSYPSSLAGAGDLDGDGRSDILVGAQTAGSDSRGAYYAYSGLDGTLLFQVEASLLGLPADPEGYTPKVLWLGRQLSGMYDFNGDGELDQLAGSLYGVVVISKPAGEFATYCNGDGGNQMGCTNCPCSNNAPQRTVGGCLNSAGSSTRLFASGDPSVSLPIGSDLDLRFSLTGAPASALSTLYSGNVTAPGNASNPCFGMNSGIPSVLLDGLRCSIQVVRRHGSRASDSEGTVGITTNPWGGEGAPPAGIAQFGAGFGAGQTRHFQAFHRDDPTLLCQTGLNTSQSIEVTFTP